MFRRLHVASTLVHLCQLYTLHPGKHHTGSCKGNVGTDCCCKESLLQRRIATPCRLTCACGISDDLLVCIFAQKGQAQTLQWHGRDLWAAVQMFLWPECCLDELIFWPYHIQLHSRWSSIWQCCLHEGMPYHMIHFASSPAASAITCLLDSLYILS